MSTAPGQTKYMAILCTGAFLVLNAGFYVLSAGYFETHKEIVAGVGSMSSYSPAQMMQVRIAFAAFTGIVAAFGFIASLQARVMGHLIPVLLGVAHLVGSVAAFQHGAPSVLGMTLLLSGVLMPVLAVSSYRGSRAAWAFLIAICGVFAVVAFFGAPKIRGALSDGLSLDISLWHTMILPGINAVAVAALVALRGEYVEHDAATA
jgi:hypothetical protein